MHDQDATRAEGTLVTRAVAGDLDAFRELYELNVDAVVGFLYKRTAPSAVEDLAAETFARAFERISKYEWRGVPFRAWLFRTAFHLVVGRSRKKSSTEMLMGEMPAVATGTAEDAAVRRLEAREIVASLDTLPDAQRVVLELRFLEDLSVPEVAEILDSTDEAVRALTYRALRALRRTIAHEPDDEGD
jgi:RNA polymerase sigma-70 factor, ECF subfamily